MWGAAERSGNAVVDLVPLAAIKLTDREKDYAVVGELARRMQRPEDQLRFSRSARDLLELARWHADLLAQARQQRPALAAIERDRDGLEEALDRERRELMRINETRLQGHERAAAAWAAAWTKLQREVDSMPLPAAHRVLCDRAATMLPFQPSAER